MNTRERLLLSITLIGIILMVLVDLVTDLGGDVPGWHTAVEGILAILALWGMYLVLRDSFRIKQTLKLERAQSIQLAQAAEQWRQQSSTFILGLSQAIDNQLNIWGLSSAEKEISFLLMKGLRSKEIAQIRKTSEKTVRAQCASIYAKSGLSGRSGLSAFFLEDLLMPPDPTDQTIIRP